MRRASYGNGRELRDSETLPPKRGETLGLDLPTSVYVIQSGEGGPVKIGTSTDVQFCLNELQTANWLDLRLSGIVFPQRNAITLEKRAHKIAGAYRIRGEWFDLEPVDAVACILVAASQLALPTTNLQTASEVLAAQAHQDGVLRMRASKERHRRELRMRLGMDDD